MSMMICKHGNNRWDCKACSVEWDANRHIRNDPSETEGQAIARQIAEAQAGLDLRPYRKVKLR